MWRGERPREIARCPIADPCKDLAVVSADDGDAWPKVRGVATETECRAALADIAVGTTPLGQEQRARPVQVAPLGFVPALAVEDLHAVVLAVGDIDPAVLIAADVVRQIELPFADAGGAPRHDQMTIGRILMH